MQTLGLCCGPWILFFKLTAPFLEDDVGSDQRLPEGFLVGFGWQFGTGRRMHERAGTTETAAL